MPDRRGRRHQRRGLDEQGHVTRLLPDSPASDPPRHLLRETRNDKPCDSETITKSLTVHHRFSPVLQDVRFTCFAARFVPFGKFSLLFMVHAYLTTFKEKWQDDSSLSTDSQREQIFSEFVALGVRGREVIYFWDPATPETKRLTYRNSSMRINRED
jgi:hypothetical protein